MSLRIATNVQALAAQRFLGLNRDKQDKSLQKMASGSRINQAADDAAGLAISENLKADIRSMNMAIKNANDGIGLIQTAEGATNEISNILIRLRELSIQGASDTIGDTERGFVDKEVQHLKSEIDRIAKTTEFNGTYLLKGEGERLDFQIGIHNRPEQDRLNYDISEQNVTLDALGLGDVSTMSKEQAQDNLAIIDRAITDVNENRADLGALQNRIGSTINNLGVYVENLSAANSRIRDTDIAHESSELVKQNILTTANIAVLGQANQNPQAALNLLS